MFNKSCFLEVLDLSDNELEELNDVELFSSLGSLTKLYLHDNPLNEINALKNPLQSYLYNYLNILGEEMEMQIVPLGNVKTMKIYLEGVELPFNHKTVNGTKN